jgi:hypothetical protein
MITIKRRTVYLVRGRTMLTRAGAYRREAFMQLMDECAAVCVKEPNERGFVDIGDDAELLVHVPCAAACRYCGEQPTLEQIDARAGLLFERDHGELGK